MNGHLPFLTSFIAFSLLPVNSGQGPTNHNSWRWFFARDSSTPSDRLGSEIHNDWRFVPRRDTGS
jgi:hypothetical protein